MPSDLKHVHDAGRQARQRGDSLVDNPLLGAEAMPATTGQGLAEWQAAIEAWEAGYRQAASN